MQTTTLSFENMHQHGVLFTNILKARHQRFIQEHKWDLPEADGMEYDQYDTPASRWIAVHEGTKVLAGIRLTPTTARCGIYSYMVRDAQRGLLDTIPTNLLFEEAPVADHIWEATRLFCSRNVKKEDLTKVQLSLLGEMSRTARMYGATEITGLVPAAWTAWLQRLNVTGKAIGPVVKIGSSKSQVVSISLRNNLN